MEPVGLGSTGTTLGCTRVIEKVRHFCNTEGDSMGSWRWTSLLLATVLVSAMPFASGAASSSSPAVGPDTVVLFLQQEPSCLNPKADACQMFVASAIRAMIFCCHNSNEGEPGPMTSDWKFLPANVGKVPSIKAGDLKANADGS